MRVGELSKDTVDKGVLEPETPPQGRGPPSDTSDSGGPSGGSRAQRWDPERYQAASGERSERGAGDSARAGDSTRRGGRGPSCLA
ncbi:hypothetical protein Cadr_000007394 [Camelus dromedarius]|uniref:Uncharacterized protein n=1 Tax=Camelus dromedarius TaxID=9838 RepID=A0A5N4E559_CAMDR|nr:hypothetical protein Cadr_000007394 [Camelus dromedarius]